MMRCIVFLFSFLATLSLQAHPGHDLMEHGPAHVVTSPFHLLIIAMVSALCLTCATFVMNPRAKRVLSSTGAVALLVAAVTWFLRQ
jgi:hypothetical protein